MGEKTKMLKALMLQACTTIYDEEGMTALELAGRTACKVNECVKMVNTLVDNVDGIIEEIINEHLGDMIAKGTFRVEGEKLILETEVVENG